MWLLHGRRWQSSEVANYRPEHQPEGLTCSLQVKIEVYAWDEDEITPNNLLQTEDWGSEHQTPLHPSESGNYFHHIPERTPLTEECFAIISSLTGRCIRESVNESGVA